MDDRDRKDLRWFERFTVGYFLVMVTLSIPVTINSVLLILDRIR